MTGNLISPQPINPNNLSVTRYEKSHSPYQSNPHLLSLSSMSRLTFDEKRRIEEKQQKIMKENELWLNAKQQANNYLR